MLISFCLIIVGLLNVLIPKTMWYLARLGYYIKSDGIKLDSENPTRLVLVISRFVGIVLVMLGMMMLII